MSEHVVRVRKVDVFGELRGTPLHYSYGSPLRVGDRVVCPSNEFTAAFVAEVVALGRDGYDGRLRPLMCRVAPDRKRK